MHLENLQSIIIDPGGLSVELIFGLLTEISHNLTVMHSSKYT